MLSIQALISGTGFDLSFYVINSEPFATKMVAGRYGLSTAGKLRLKVQLFSEEA
jgi:hypothetical protein